MCEILEQKCIQRGLPESSLTLSRVKSHLKHLQKQNAKQCVLDKWLVKNGSQCHTTPHATSV